MLRNGKKDFAKEMKKLWNAKETVMPIVVDSLETVSKGLDKRRVTRDQRKNRATKIILTDPKLGSVEFFRKFVTIAE